MSLDQIITLNIDRTTVTPTAQGFGQPCVVAYFPTTIFPERTREYSNLTDMVTDGFLVTDPAYLAVSSCLAQNPSPPTVKVGRRALPPQQVLRIAPPDPSAGGTWTINITGYTAAGVSVTDSATTTQAPAADEEDVVDSWIVFLTVNGDYTAVKEGTGSSATLLVTALNTTAGVDGLLFGITADNGSTVTDETPDPGIATDLAAIATYDPDWYGLIIDSNGEDEIAAAAGWVASAEPEKIFACQTQDPDVANVADSSDTTSIAAVLKAASRERTMLFFHRNNLEYACAAMLGNALPEDPGTINWSYRILTGATAQGLTTSQQGILEDKNANYVVSLAGVTATRWGSSSQGEWMDVIRGSDWVKARIQERLYGVLLQLDKVPYTDGGLQIIRSEILAQLQTGVDRGFLAAEPAPTCTVPRASEVSQADKGNRVVNDVTFRAVLAGAVNKIAIEGTLALS